MSLNTELDPDRASTEEGRQALRLAEDLCRERRRVKELEAALWVMVNCYHPNTPSDHRDFKALEFARNTLNHVGR